MFRMWGKLMKDNHLLKDTVVCISDYSLSRTQMVFDSLDSICYEFDLEKPIWLDSTVKEFKYHDKARFTQDNFIGDSGNRRIKRRLNREKPFHNRRNGRTVRHQHTHPAVLR